MGQLGQLNRASWSEGPVVSVGSTCLAGSVASAGLAGLAGQKGQKVQHRSGRIRRVPRKEGTVFRDRELIKFAK